MLEAEKSRFDLVQERTNKRTFDSLFRVRFHRAIGVGRFHSKVLVTVYEMSLFRSDGTPTKNLIVQHIRWLTARTTIDI